MPSSYSATIVFFGFNGNKSHQPVLDKLLSSQQGTFSAQFSQIVDILS
jgi:hypothetical protein